MKHSEEAFIEAWKRARGSPTETARILRMGVRSVLGRRRRLADKGVALMTQTARGIIGPTGASAWSIPVVDFPRRRNIECWDGYVLIGSDAHYWPGVVSIAHRAFVAAAKKLQPQHVILNGDVLDGARISRHDPMCWEEGRPALNAEIECVADRLKEIRDAAPNAQCWWTIGNHDSRFERYLAMRAPEVHGVPGSALKDHFPGWSMSWSILINEKTSPTIVKHALKGGAHAVYNNTLHAGISIVTGHLHAQLCRPFTDYRGTRYGVDSGTMADIDAASFAYTLDSPVNWRSGFAVLAYDDCGRLLPPALCEVQTFGDYQRAVFQGEVVVESEKTA